MAMMRILHLKHSQNPTVLSLYFPKKNSQIIAAACIKAKDQGRDVKMANVITGNCNCGRHVYTIPKPTDMNLCRK